MGLVFKYGLMVQDMKENGSITKLMERENSGMLMEMCMKVIGKMTKPMAMESTFMSMGLSMKETGRMICKMDSELSPGLMEANTKEAIKKE